MTGGPPPPGRRGGRLEQRPAKQPSAHARATAPRAAASDPRRRLWDNLKSIVGAILIFLFVRVFLVEAYRIPTGSMEPTLLVGDWLFVNKLAYGPHIPVLNVNLPGYAAPKRRDVVVFVSPPQPDNAPDITPTLVKRLWGLPGDTVYMRSGVLYINGAAYPQGPAFASNQTQPDFPDSAHFAWQARYGLTNTRFGSAPAQPTHDNWGPLLVPPAHYFMMGDNRYDSKDSRYWGFVPRTNFRGRPMFVYYSYDTEAGLDYFRAVTEIRWSRIGHWVR
jgi:signal peptidase I